MGYPGYHHPCLFPRAGLFQCEPFLARHPGWVGVAHGDTAGSAQYVAQTGDITKAAICSSRAAELYGLEILARGVNYNSNNTTRFVVVSPVMELREGADKISAVIKCVEERISGNRDFSKAEQTITQAIRDMGLPEADYFMDEFLPSYGLTIEEQDYTREAGLKFSESSQLVFSKVLPEKGPRKKKRG